MVVRELERKVDLNSIQNEVSRQRIRDAMEYRNSMFDFGRATSRGYAHEPEPNVLMMSKIGSPTCTVWHNTLIRWTRMNWWSATVAPSLNRLTTPRSASNKRLTRKYGQTWSVNLCN
jgi:hypothetical protein